ncbi:hypothetical protein F4802DRAFT_598791 [Xylaria palmicola]|nr:hypothetical protein F4802DRAFT_598791 [Xylaria palmicola]
MEYQTPTPSFQATTSGPGPAMATAPPDMAAHFQPPPPPPPQFEPQQQQQQAEPVVTSPFVGTDLPTLKTACGISLREYATLQKQGRAGPGYERLRAQGALAASDLRALRSEVAALLKRAEAGRWRKWLLGGLIAAIIPAVRRLFRRPADDRVSSNDTEHAFRKSKSLVTRILDSVRSGGGGRWRLASVAGFVLAVLYVFQGEVALRVARTVARRLRRLVAKVEDGVEDVDEADLKVLNGWRWRVLLW